VNPLRQRFTLAHELGHAALHELDPSLDQSGFGVERLCDLFAGELLMPTKLVQTICRETENAEAIVKLAYRTKTSLDASCVRIEEYLGSVITGLASDDGSIINRYGVKLTSSWRDALARACKITPAGKHLEIKQNGLIVCTRAVDNGRVVFLIRRKSEEVRFQQDAGRPRPSGSDVRGHAFISYVREDSKTVDRLERDLEQAGITVWRDRSSLGPGDRWKDSIRQAIASGAFFLCCFSDASGKRPKSYMNEELNLAVDELRIRNREQAWFLPVVFPGGVVPDWPISTAESLRDFNYIVLSPGGWSAGVKKLVQTMQKS
jgi:hypothetical protein